jgi:hypothetical protein
VEIHDVLVDVLAMPRHGSSSRCQCGLAFTLRGLAFTLRGILTFPPCDVGLA